MNILSDLVPDKNLEGLLPGVLGGDHEGGAAQHRLLIHSDRGMPENCTRKMTDPGCLSRIRTFSIPDPRSASKNRSILTQKIVSKLSEMIRVVHPRSGS